MNRLEQDIYDNILSQQLADKAKLDEIIREASENKVPFLHHLLSKNNIPEGKLLNLLSEFVHLPFIDLKNTDIEDKAIKFVPVRIAWHYEFMPVSFNDNKLIMAVNIPLSIRAQDEIKLTLGCDIGMLLARREHIFDSLKKHYGLASETVDRMVGIDRDILDDNALSVYDDIEDIAKKAEDASVARLVNQIILEAHSKRATDIHIEPYRGRLTLRYRIDGKLQDQPVSNDFMRFLLPILSRIKIMANLNIVERRLPQDGRAIVKIQDQVLDLRVSSMPTPHGESIVVRILPSKAHWKLDNLGLLPEDVKTFEKLLSNSSGILLVTGPTGSGKTTTLYSCIEKLNTKDRKILSIEDPIEYEIKGIVQVQVNPEIGLTFGRGLRSMLRQDPDVMMVGEIRDKETAEIAIRVALTGHLVLSTLHTNDAASGITRAIDIGIPPYLITSTVKAFIAQRLLRVICDECKVEDKDASTSLKNMIAENTGIPSDEVKVFKGAGCEKCGSTGFYGRTAIYEILVVNEEIRKMIIEGRSAGEIKKAAVETSGMRTLIKDGCHKVNKGITTPGEVLDACQDTDVLSWGN